MSYENDAQNGFGEAHVIDLGQQMGQMYLGPEGYSSYDMMMALLW